MSTTERIAGSSAVPQIAVERNEGRVAVGREAPAAGAGAAAAVNTVIDGTTDHFVVAHDDNVPNGQALARSVLDSCENYYTKLKEIFGGVEPPPGIPVLYPDIGVPFHIHIRVGTTGATHGGCNNTSIWVDAFSGNDTTLIDALVVMEIDEVFMAAQGKSWDCGSSQGEALSRLLAYDITGFTGNTPGYTWLAASNWLNSPRQDFVSYNDPNDGNFVTIGCGTLFLNYMRHERGVTMERIVQLGAPELSTALHTITGDPGDIYPFPPFKLLMHVHYPENFGAAPLALDNPFPLGLPTTPLDGLVHLQDIGDVGWMNDKFNGTIGQSRRIEGFELKINPPVPNLGIRYMAHIENHGDVPYQADGAFIGTRGQGLRLEGFAVELTGTAAPHYTVMYMANIQDIGLTPFFADGQFCGTRGLSKRVEGMLVHVQPR